ncbi:MAG TPA: ABC transporter substrate-binding protein [Jiangellaceae bacterium]
MAISARRRIVGAIGAASALSLVLAACGGDDDGGGDAGSGESVEGGTVSVLVVWGGAELDSFEAMLAPFEEETGIDVQTESTRDLNAVLTTRLAGGNPPDVAGLPGPGPMAEFARAGDLKPLAQDVLDVLESDYNEGIIADATVDDELVGIFIRTSVKGLIWYNPAVFEAGGYEVPTDWDSLTSLVDDAAAAGTTPWGIGLESGGDTGWPATDWIEDFVIRQSGPEVYDDWVQGELKWSSDEIKAAWEAFGDWATDPAYVSGGPNAVLNTPFGNGGDCLFAEPAGCLLHHQASFITSFFEENNPGVAQAGTTYDFFSMPAMEHNGVVYAGDLFGMFNDTPQAQALMEYLVTPEAQQIWVERGAAISANQNVPLDVYPDDTSRRSAEILVGADEIRFDGSDKMPAEMNRAFFTAVLDFVKNPDDLDNILENLDSVQESAYES